MGRLRRMLRVLDRTANKQCCRWAGCTVTAAGSWTDRSFSVARPQPPLVSAGRGQLSCHTSSEQSEQKDEKELVYEGPFHTILRKVKYVSVFSSGATLTSMPILSALNDTISVQGRIAIGITCCVFAVGTTGLVQLIGKPYVAKIWRVGSVEEDIADQTIEVQTYSLFAQPKIMRFDVSTVTPPTGMSPFMSFASGGNNFYIHSNQELFSQLELYTRLNLKPS